MVVSINAGAPTDIPLEMLFDRLRHKQSSLELLLHNIFAHQQFLAIMRDVRYYLYHNPEAQLDIVFWDMSIPVDDAPSIVRLYYKG
jgi:hypothetical protein